MGLCLLTLLLATPLAAQDLAAAAKSADQALDEYRIGIEDVLRVAVWGEPGLSIEALKVRPDGKITVPLVNDIHVVGLTPLEVKELITGKLGEFIREPNVTVIVQQINSFRIYFLGEVTTQGAINFTRPPRLLQAVAAAGGLTQFSKKEIVLLRQQGGVEKRYPINYKQLLAGDPRQENLWLQPGDTLLFP
jgi:polysaccharide export outer membrane protein